MNDVARKMSGVKVTDTGERAILQDVDVSASSQHAASEEDVWTTFDIKRTLEFVTTGQFHKVGLQFPDSLLSSASTVCATLGSELGKECQVFVLADTMYGSCCVDFATAAHWGADAIVHYGPACLSVTTGELPVLHVFPKNPIDVALVQQHLSELSQSADGPVVLLYDLSYHHALTQIAEELDVSGVVLGRPRQTLHTSPQHQEKSQAASTCRHDSQKAGSSHCDTCHCSPSPSPSPPASKAPPVVSSAFSAVPTDTSLADEGEQEGEGEGQGQGERQGEEHSQGQAQGDVEGLQQEQAGLHRVGGLEFVLPEQVMMDSVTMLYVGGDGLQLTHILMTCNQSKIWSFSPHTNKLREEGLNTNRKLMKRYMLIQKAMDAEVVGILVATLAVAHYQDTIHALSRAITASGRKPYTIVVGKLNEAKLANFSDIVDVFVVVACPLNSLIDSTEYHKPIITPFELQIAVDWGKGWTGAYHTDFDQFLKMKDTAAAEGAEGEGEEEEGGVDGDEARVSLVTGRVMRRPRVQLAVDEPTSTTSSALVTTSEQRSIALTHSAEALARRTFQGIEARVGQDSVEGVVEGRKGIASRFEGEENE